MIRLAVVIAALAAVYSGIWAAGRAGLGKGLDQAEAALAQSQVALDYDSRRVAGYPSRLDTTWRDLRVSWPGGNVALPMVQALTLVYRPTDIIAVAKGPIDATTGGLSWRLTPDDLRASLRLGAAMDLPLRELRAEMTDAVLTLSDSQALTLPRVFVAAREADAPSYDLFATVENARLSSAMTIPGMPAQIDQITVAGAVTLTAPVNRMAQPRAVTALTLDGTQITWGASTATAKGALTIPPSGWPKGTITVTLRAWEPLVDAAVQSGLLDPEVAKTLRNAAGMMAQDGAVSLPLSFADGRTRLGPLPIGPSPRFPPYLQ